MRLLVFKLPLLLLFMLGVTFLGSRLSGGKSPGLLVAEDGSSVDFIDIPMHEATLEVRPMHQGNLGQALMGRTEHQDVGVRFVPVAPFLRGQSYRAQWRSSAGKLEAREFAGPEEKASTPTVSFSPGTALPANALKFYLHFSEPMEQGVFLDRLRLLDSGGKEVVGPFRETELWTPDGKRLTVWFHPGRQKTGVNLNVDEGPVLRPNDKYALEVSGTWRSIQGVAIGRDVKFAFSTTGADHECPQASRWTLSAPQAGRLEPLQVSFDEALDPAMLQSALRVRKVGAEAALEGNVEAATTAMKWSFIPKAAWEVRSYEVIVDPLLEDLAGNNLLKPFEVDLQETARVPDQPVGSLRFSVRE